MLIVAVVLVGGGIVLVVARMAAGAGRDREPDDRRPVHHEVSTPYHEHTDLTGAGGGDVDRTSSATEHQVEEGGEVPQPGPRRSPR